MRKIFSFFFPKTIDKVKSSINGKIEVIEQFGKKTIKVEGLEQSGPMVEKIWEKGIKNLPTTNYQLLTTKILILGLGGGSAVKIINQYFPQAKILGIEIDPVMIKLGKEYLGLSEYKNLEIKIDDAFRWSQQNVLNNSNIPKKFDLILVDLYLGRDIPGKVENENFLNSLKELLKVGGLVIFNRLKGKDKKVSLQKFLDKLGKVYHDIKVIKPVANYLIICQ